MRWFRRSPLERLGCFFVPPATDPVSVDAGFIAGLRGVTAGLGLNRWVTWSFCRPSTVSSTGFLLIPAGLAFVAFLCLCCFLLVPFACDSIVWVFGFWG